MGWWKADPVPSEPKPTSRAPIPSPPPQSSADACPVDPKTRAIWLQQAQKQQQQSSSPQTPLPPSHPPISTASRPSTVPSSTECSSDRIDQSLSSPPSYTSASVPNLPRPLSTDRVVSSIPRAAQQPSTTPANSESETGAHRSGNWIYPSESQFFHAVLRKHSPSSMSSLDPSTAGKTSSNGQATASSREAELAQTMPTIIPIHNAVNERAWSLIRSWEGSSSAACGGPKLASFKGLGAGALSPKARWNSLLGYQAPFDRHDWVVERCDGTQVEYLIDFYQGKEEVGGRPGQLNFYLDVRPKVNSWEGCKMRAEKMFGIR